MKLLLTLLVSLTALCSYGLSPRKEYTHKPEEYAMEYEEFQVVTADSAILNGWYFTPTSMTGRLVLICHSGEGNMSDYLDRVDYFINLDYTVVLFDYRGFGKSSPFKINANQYIYPEFIEDVKAMLKFSRDYTTYPIVMYGWGIGAGLSLSVGYQDDKVGQIISDSPYLTLSGISHHFRKHNIDLRMPTGFPAAFEPYNTFDNVPGKRLKHVLLIVPDHYGIYSLKDMTLLKDKRPTITEIAALPSSFWNDPYKDNPSFYFERIGKFLDENY
jgi:pimeloyl-ACP methyl ester carboxylesterase